MISQFCSHWMFHISWCKSFDLELNQKVNENKNYINLFLFIKIFSNNEIINLELLKFFKVKWYFLENIN